MDDDLNVWMARAVGDGGRASERRRVNAGVGSAGGSAVWLCLFVTFCHCNKHAFIVVRCQRLEGVGFLRTALLRFCETVYGPFGRHTS